MYFSAIGFIYDVKKGPFWEHSPILYDISGVKAGWAKINKVSLVYRSFLVTQTLSVIQGMIKMYNVEVLSKFPVVQHFPFGALFAWEADASARSIQASVHTSSQPKASTDHSSTIPSSTSSTSAYSSPRLQPHLRAPQAESTLRTRPLAPSSARAQPPLREPITGGIPSTSAPWATSTSRPATGPAVPSGPNQPTRAPWQTRTPAPPPPGDEGTMAPWARGRNAGAARGSNAESQAGTTAPWADDNTQGHISR
jgi:serine/threonine-protein phosphatase 2A activator